MGSGDAEQGAVADLQLQLADADHGLVTNDRFRIVKTSSKTAGPTRFDLTKRTRGRGA